MGFSERRKRSASSVERGMGMSGKSRVDGGVEVYSGVGGSKRLAMVCGVDGSVVLVVLVD